VRFVVSHVYLRVVADGRFLQRVAQAAASVMGSAGAVTHEALFIGIRLLDFAPVPGLAGAAQTLLKIWDAVQLVDV
jgi:hypothetical protein